MNQARNICNKTYMTEGQHRDLVADARAARKSVSTYLADCYEAVRNSNAPSRPAPRPSVAPFRAQMPAKFLPGRASRGFANMRH